MSNSSASNSPVGNSLEHSEELSDKESANKNRLEAKSDEISVVATKFPGLEFHLDITVSPKIMETAHTGAIKAVNKEISLPGFRKGKAPTQLILSQYAKPVQDKWREIVTNRGFQEALRLLDLHLFSQEVQLTKLEEFSLEKGARFTVKFEASPNVPIIDVNEIDIPLMQPEAVTDENIEETITKLRLQTATWENIEGRAAEFGDYVTLNVHKIDEEPSVTVIEEQRFKIDQKTMTPWLTQLVMGLQPGQSVEGNSDESQPDTLLNLPAATAVRVTLKAINRPDLPELDESFFSSIGVESLESLKAIIRQGLTEEARQNSYKQQVALLDAWLLKHYPVEVPRAFFEMEKKRIWQKQEKILERYTLSKEAIAGYKAQLEADHNGPIYQYCQVYLLLIAFSQQMGINVSHKEYQERMLRARSTASQEPVEYSIQDLTVDKARHYLLSRMAVQK